MKKLLSGILLVALLICLSVVAVSATEGTTKAVTKQTWSHLTVASDGQTATGYCPHCCDNTSQTVTWNLYTRTSGHNLLSTSGHYFLGADSNMTGALRPNVEGLDFVLHLNGKTFTRSGNGNTTGAVYVNAANTTFSIVDDQQEKGALVGTVGSAVNANSKAGTRVVLYSGNLTSTTSTVTNASGGTVTMSAGTFEMYGGTINGSIATYGGALAISGATTVNINGGTIRGGKATARGGNIYMASTTSTLNISGGVIENGVCQERGIGGGNIYANNGTLNITGGTIRGGKAVSGGNLYANTATTINGAVSFENGKATYGGNVYTNGNLTVTAGSFVKGTATYGGNLYVNKGTFTLGNAFFVNGAAKFGSDIYVTASAKMSVDTTYNGTACVYYALNHLPDGIYNKTLVNTQISCKGAFQGQLFLDNISGKPRITRSGSTTSLIIASKDSAALVDKDGNYTWYAENDQAVAAYNANTAYMVAGGASLPLTGGNYVVDLAGHNVTITGTGTVTCFDSANEDHKTYGQATINGPTLNNTFKTTVNGKNVYMVQSGNAYTFHYMDIKIIGVSVRTSAAGIYYTGNWFCDDLLATQVKSFGVAVSTVNKPKEDFATDKDTKYTQFANDKFVSGTPKTGVIIKEIVKTGAANNMRASKRIYAEAYVVFQNDSVYITNNTDAYSLTSVINRLNKEKLNYIQYADQLQEFCDQWNGTNLGWNANFEISDDVKQLNEVYDGRTAYQGEAHDHAATEGGSDGKYTLEQLTQSLPTENMDFTTIVDHHQDKHMRMDAWNSDLFIGGTEASSALLDDEYTALTSNKVHYSMIFTDYSQLDTVLKNKLGGSHVSSWRPTTDRVNWVSFDYKDMTKAEFQELIAAVKAAGGMFTIVHPKSSGYIASSDPLMYYFADWTGLEVFYGAGGYAPTQAVNQENYKLWTDLLAAGKKIWATAGSDVHGAPNTNALTTIYSNSSSATSIFNYMKVGDSTCGPVGIRMCVGDTSMGGETDFAGKRLVFSVGDFHESLDSTHTYRVDLISDTGVVYSQEISAAELFYYGMNADDSAKFYRVEIWDVTVGYDLPIAIGNPIWNN